MQFLSSSIKVEGYHWQRKSELFHCVWRKEALPQEFKDASIIHLSNGKEFFKYVTTTEESLSYQDTGKILLNRLNVHLDQAGYRNERGTIDVIFTARQLQEKCQEQNVDLYMTFVDLPKVFDSQS